MDEGATKARRKRPKVLQERLTILVKPELAARVKALAEHREIPFSIMLRQAIAEWVDNEERAERESRP